MRFLFFSIVLISFFSLFFCSAIQKEQAIFSQISNYFQYFEDQNISNLSKENISSIDNFIGMEQKEYAIVYFNLEPYFVFEIQKNDSSYIPKLIEDNQSIEQIVLSRPAYNFSNPENIATVFKPIWKNIDLISNELKIKQLKYETLLGLVNSSCNSSLECKELCTNSFPCSNLYSYSFEGISDSIAEFSQLRDNSNLIFSSEKQFRENLSSKNNSEILLFYFDFFDSLEKLKSSYENLKLNKEDSIFYSGHISFNSTLLSDSKSILNNYSEQLKRKEQLMFIVSSIQKNTATFLELKQKKELLSSLSNNSNLSNQSNQTENLVQLNQENTTNIEENLSNEKVFYKNGTISEYENKFLENILNNLDLILTFIAIVLVLYWAFKFYFENKEKFLKKKENKPKNKKEIRSLEDL
jgi:hypothetical protein